MKRFLLILLALVMLLCVCSCANKSSAEDENANSIQETSDLADVAESTTPIEFYQSDKDTSEISTPYGSLSYPAEWQGVVTTEVIESDTAYAVKFSASLDSTSVPLYTIVFGESETGFMLGELTTDNGTVSVYCEDHTAEQGNQLSEASKETYNSLCVGLNDIISNLVYENGMTIY